MSQSYPNSYEQSAPKQNSTLKIVLIVVGCILGVMILGCGILAALLFPAISAAREAALRQMASNDLRMIGLALHNYEATFRRLPSLHGVNHADEATGSWRVAISPFMENASVYDQFDHHQAWDGPTNRALADQMPACFRSALASPDQPEGHTNVFAIRDPGSVMPHGGVYRKFGEVSDGVSNTLAMIQLPEYSTPWMEPKDLTIAEALQHIRASVKPEQIQILLLDGSVRPLGAMSDEDFTSLVIIDDGKIIALPE